MDKKVVEYILKCDKQKSLEYKWYCRNLALDTLKDKKLQDIIKSIALSSFEYYNNHADSIKNDRTLAIACSICNCENTALTTTCIDHSVTELGHYFNTIAKSGRKVKMCYDCGTVARAIFLNTIHNYRGELTNSEKKKIEHLYNPNRTTPLNALNEFYYAIKSTKKHTIFILSIGLDEFGHVWVFEKIIDDNGKERVIMYQSSLNSYLLMDYIEYMDMAKNKNGINIDEFYRDMMQLMLTKNWKDKENKLFSKWFQFMPTSEVTEVKTFLYCGISLDSPTF